MQTMIGIFFFFKNDWEDKITSYIVKDRPNCPIIKSCPPKFNRIKHEKSARRFDGTVWTTSDILCFKKFHERKIGLEKKKNELSNYKHILR